MRMCAAIVGLAVLIGASPSQAVSITNRDDADRKFTVIEKDARNEHILKPAGVLDGVCLKGCILRIGDTSDDEYELEGSEVVSIENKVLYYDGADADSEMVPGTSTLPPPSRAPAPATGPSK